MRLGGLAVAFTPLLRGLDHLAQQLLDHHRHHDLPQHRHEPRNCAEPEQPHIQQHRQFTFAHSGIDIGRGHRTTGCISDAFLPVLFIQIAPQIDLVAAMHLAF